MRLVCNLFDTTRTTGNPCRPLLSSEIKDMTTDNPVSAAIPLDTLIMLADISMSDEHDDNGPGRSVCPGCGEYMMMKWHNGGRLDDPSDIVHLKNCPIAWAKTYLKCFYRTNLRLEAINANSLLATGEYDDQPPPEQTQC